MKRAQVITLTIATLAVAGGVIFLTFQNSGSSRDRISLPKGVALCSHFGADEKPYLSATVVVNASSPLSSISAYVNGTSEGSAHYSFNGSNYTTTFSTNPTTTIVAGVHYEVVLVAAFVDGTSYSAHSQVIAC